MWAGRGPTHLAKKNPACWSARQSMPDALAQLRLLLGTKCERRPVRLEIKALTHEGADVTLEVAAEHVGEAVQALGRFLVLGDAREEEAHCNASGALTAGAPGTEQLVGGVLQQPASSRACSEGPRVIGDDRCTRQGPHRQPSPARQGSRSLPPRRRKSLGEALEAKIEERRSLDLSDGQLESRVEALAMFTRSSREQHQVNLQRRKTEAACASPSLLIVSPRGCRRDSM